MAELGSSCWPGVAALSFTIQVDQIIVMYISTSSKVSRQFFLESALFTHTQERYVTQRLIEWWLCVVRKAYSLRNIQRVIQARCQLMTEAIKSTLYTSSQPIVHGVDVKEDFWPSFELQIWLQVWFLWPLHGAMTSSTISEQSRTSGSSHSRW